MKKTGKTKKNATYGRILFLIVCIIISMILCLTSCSNADKDNQNDNTENDRDNESTQTLDEEQPDDSIKFVLPTEPTKPENESGEQNGETAETDNHKENSEPTETAETTDRVIPSFQFLSNGDGTCSVSGIGNINDNCIVIPTNSPNGDIVTSIAPMAFYNCTQIVAVQISAKIKSIGSMAFGKCSNLVYISVSNDNKYYCDINGVLYTKDKTELLCCPDAVNLSSIVIDKELTVIHSMAFYECNQLKTVNYRGTREEWAQIIVGEKNYSLSSAAVSYNYTIQ